LISIPVQCVGLLQMGRERERERERERFGVQCRASLIMLGACVLWAPGNIIAGHPAWSVESRHDRQGSGGALAALFRVWVRLLITVK
jgi:hypothetical protein